MGNTSTWVQEKTELFEGELVVFKRANSPNWYMRVYVAQERKHYQKSLKTRSQYDAIEKAKREYKIIQSKVAKEQKVFTITLEQAIDGYYETEKQRERRGIIGADWLRKKQGYLGNTFLQYWGADKKVDEITDKEMEKYIDERLRCCKRKQSIKQEIVIIKHFYTSFLIKKGFVFKVPEFPQFRLKKKDLSRREDTFSVQEWEKLFKFMREWVKPKNISNVRSAVKQYGKASNTEKVLNEWEHQMEIHRRRIMRELILIAGNTGIRLPKELFSLKWKDVRIKKEIVDGQYGTDKKVEQLVAVIQIGEEHKTGARSVIALAGSYFIRLKEYYRNELDYEPKADDFVFMEFYGRRKYDAFDRYAFYRLWGELMRDAGLNRIKFTPYNLRSFYITQSILNGIDLLLISKNCGNSVATILSHYEFVNMEHQTSKLIQRRDVKKEIENEIEF